MSSVSNHRYDQIGLDRVVRLQWLQRTANLVLAGNDAAAIKTSLQEDLQGAFRSGNRKIRGSLDKTITILMKIWVRPPLDLHPLHREGLELLSHLPREGHIAVHWGMAMAVYPFWGAVAAHVGRLLRLQGTAAASQVQRRVREKYGERETVSRRVRYVLRSFVDWGVLRDASPAGKYAAGGAIGICRLELIGWLVECFLHAHQDDAADLDGILRSPVWFPFALREVMADELAGIEGRIEVLPHGLDRALICLRPAAEDG